MIQERSIRGVIFDLDDTLYFATDAYAKGVQAVVNHLIARNLVSYSEKELASLFLEARETVKRRLPSGHTSSHNRVLYFKVFVELLFGSCSPALCLDLIEIHDRTVARVSDLLERERLLKLKRRLSFAIVTDEMALTQLRKLKALDPSAELFDCLIISEEWGLEKPNVILFEEALRRLGLRSDEVLMIGDHFRKDILGADQAGIRSWWVTQERKSPTKVARLVGQGPFRQAVDWLERVSEVC